MWPFGRVIGKLWHDRAAHVGCCRLCLYLVILECILSGTGRAVLPAHISIRVPARTELAHWIPEVTDRPGHVHAKGIFHMPLGSESFENSFPLGKNGFRNCLGLKRASKMAPWVRVRAPSLTA